MNAVPDPRTASAALIRFYADDLGPCASYTIGFRSKPVTLGIPAGAEEMTVELVLSDAVVEAEAEADAAEQRAQFASAE